MQTAIAPVSPVRPCATVAPVGQPSVSGVAFPDLLDTISMPAKKDREASPSTGKALPPAPATGKALPGSDANGAVAVGYNSEIAEDPDPATASEPAPDLLPLSVLAIVPAAASPLPIAVVSSDPDPVDGNAQASTPTSKRPAPATLVSEPVPPSRVIETNPPRIMPSIATTDPRTALRAAENSIHSTTPAKIVEEMPASAMTPSDPALIAAVDPTSRKSSGITRSPSPSPNVAARKIDRDKPTARAIPAPDTTAPAMPTVRPAPVSADSSPIAVLNLPNTPPASIAIPTSTAIARPDRHAAIEALTRTGNDDGVAGLLQMRNPDFGAISVRLEMAGAVLNAKLGNDDPDFRVSIVAAADVAATTRTSAPETAGHRPTDRQPGDNPSAGQQASQRNAPPDHGRTDPEQPSGRNGSTRRLHPTLSLLPATGDEAAAPPSHRAGGIYA